MSEIAIIYFLHISHAGLHLAWVFITRCISVSDNGLRLKIFLSTVIKNSFLLMRLTVVIQVCCRAFATV